MKFMGGKIAIHGMRFLENDIVDGAIRITNQGGKLSSINRKIMYKMLIEKEITNGV